MSFPTFQAVIRVRNRRNSAIVEEQKKRKIVGEVRHFISSGERASKSSRASPACPFDEGSMQVKTLGCFEAVD
jgi:hypothetical protein